MHHHLNFDPMSTVHFTVGEICCHLLFLFIQSQSVCLPPLIYWPFTAVAGWWHMRKMSDPSTLPPRWDSVGNGETQYYFSHQRGDALNTLGSDGLWWGAVWGVGMCVRVCVCGVGGVPWLAHSFHTTAAPIAEEQTDGSMKELPCMSSMLGGALPALINFISWWLSYHFIWPSSFCRGLCGRVKEMVGPPTHSILPDSVPFRLPCPVAEWLAHCVISVTQNPFTALNRCPCPPPPPPPLSNDTLPPSCPLPAEDDKSPSGP